MKTPTPWQLTITRWPDGSFNGRPYVTSNGEHVCEGYLNELGTASLQHLVNLANSVPSLLEALKELDQALVDRAVKYRQDGQHIDADICLDLASIAIEALSIARGISAAGIPSRLNPLDTLLHSMT